MEIRGIGDRHGFRRLAWLFATTIFAPGMLLGLLALGALGHQSWSESEVARREATVQAPLVARLVDAEVAAVVARGCDEDGCLGDHTLVGLSPDGSWAPNPRRIHEFADDLIAADGPVDLALRLSRTPAPGAAALSPPLGGWFLVPDPPLAAFDDRRANLEAVAAIILLALLLVGAVTGLRSAAREIRVSRRQTDLVSRVSHELRTPMTSIRMFVDTLRSDRVAPDRRDEVLDLLSTETERLMRRIEDVLLWARMEAGSRSYAAEEATPASLVDDAVAALRAQLFEDDPDTRLEIAVPDDLPAVQADRDAVVEALVNLLVNAVRHTPSPRHIRVSARAEGRWVGLSVADDGPGIPAADRRRIFEKFYQGRTAAPPDSPKGTGLGLAIVRAIARAQGGRVDLVSSPQAGSTFTLWLPMV